MTVIGAGMLEAWCGHLVPGFDKQRLGSLPAAAIRHMLPGRRVHVLNIGMRLKEEIDANIKTLGGDLSCTWEDRALLADSSARLYDTDAMKNLRTK